MFMSWGACFRLTMASLALPALIGAAWATDTKPPVAPLRAAGLWELKNTGSGGTVIGTQRLCVSAASEAKTNLFGQIALNVNCSKYEAVQSGNNWTFEFVCGPAEMTSTSKGTVTGDFASAYTVEMTESDGTIQMARTIEGMHKGACPAGVAPGTLLDEKGQIITNILD